MKLLNPGAYVGTYSCKLVMQGMPTEWPIDGDVSFELEANTKETMQRCPAGAEFCDFDLVIKEGTGKLFGFVYGSIGFQTGLQGGLDLLDRQVPCIPTDDPDNPGQYTVGAQLGTFDGSLDGLHNGKVPQQIAGMWNLGEPSL